MDTSLNNLPLPLWQGTTLTWMAGFILFLLLSLIVMALLISFKRKGKNKIFTVLGFILGAFVLFCVIYIAMGVSFVVDIGLGWKLSLLAGTLVVLFAISSIAIIYNVVGCPMKKRHVFIWLTLFTISLASALILGVLGAQKAQKQSMGHSLPQ